MVYKYGVPRNRARMELDPRASGTAGERCAAGTAAAPWQQCAPPPPRCRSALPGHQNQHLPPTLRNLGW